MSSRFSWTLIGLVAILLLGFVSQGRCYQGPDDPAAVEAARRAVSKLGPSRGALGVSGAVWPITGRTAIPIPREHSSAIQGQSTEVKRALADLGAETVGCQIHLSLSGDVLFDFDRWTIRKEAETSLTKLVQAARGLAVEQILIAGHTDAKGAEAYNLALSRKRAEAVKQWLVKRGGLDAAIIVTKGYGESQPIAPNTNPDGTDNPQGRAKNRRVEITMTVRTP